MELFFLHLVLPRKLWIENSFTWNEVVYLSRIDFVLRFTPKTYNASPILNPQQAHSNHITNLVPDWHWWQPQNASCPYPVFFPDPFCWPEGSSFRGCFKFLFLSTSFFFTIISYVCKTVMYITVFRSSQRQPCQYSPQWPHQAGGKRWSWRLKDDWMSAGDGTNICVYTAKALTALLLPLVFAFQSPSKSSLFDLVGWLCYVSDHNAPKTLV